MTLFPRTATLGALALLAPACMLNPENGSQVDDTTTPITFSGVHVAPSTAIQLQSTTSPLAAPRTFATAHSSSRALRVNGTSLYSWSTKARVLRWRTTSCGSKETFVRAVDSNGLSLLTFDSATETTESGVSCLLSRLGNGDSVLIAASSCRSDDSPFVHLTTPATYSGDVTIATTSDIATYSCYTKIDGSLTLADADLTSVVLPNLVTITGDLEVNFSRLPSTSSFVPDVTEVELAALETVGGNVSLIYDGGSSDLLHLDVGLNALANVGGDIGVSLHTFNVSLNGLDSLTEIPGDLSVISSGDDFSLSGFAPALTHVHGDVTLSSDNTATSMLGALVTVGGDVNLEGLYIPPTTSNFTHLATIGGDLRLRDLRLVTTTSTPRQLGALASVGGLIDFDGVGLFHTFALGSTTSLSIGGLRLNAVSLQDLNAPALVVAPTGSITITNDSLLSQCLVDDFVAAQTALGWGGTLITSGNLACP